MFGTNVVEEIEDADAGDDIGLDSTPGKSIGEKGQRSCHVKDHIYDYLCWYLALTGQTSSKSCENMWLMNFATIMKSSTQFSTCHIGEKNEGKTKTKKQDYQLPAWQISVNKCLYMYTFHTRPQQKHVTSHHALFQSSNQEHNTSFLLNI